MLLNTLGELSPEKVSFRSTFQKAETQPQPRAIFLKARIPGVHHRMEDQSNAVFFSPSFISFLPRH